jgi:dephospho-CoA kinase
MKLLIKLLEIVAPGTPAYFQIVDHFGVTVLNDTSSLDRGALGNIIFNSDEERKTLNNITHPRIRLVLLQRICVNFLMGNSMIVLDTPLLFEAGLFRWVHSTVVVYCPIALQLERLMARDGINQMQAKAKMNSQMSIEQKITLANHIIDNSGSLPDSRRQTEVLMRRLTPSLFSVLFIWLVFFWPVLCLYFALCSYSVYDHWRYAGFVMKRSVPQIVQLKAKD